MKSDECQRGRMALNAFADQAAALDTVTMRCSGRVDMGVRQIKQSNKVEKDRYRVDDDNPAGES